MTDRWQNFTDVCLNAETLSQLAVSCSEFLVHAVDAEGLRKGPQLELVDLLADTPIPVTYAGGIASFEDLEEPQAARTRRVDVSIGSALDLFGGYMPYHEVLCVPVHKILQAPAADQAQGTSKEMPSAESTRSELIVVRIR